MSGPGLFAGWCSRATREKSWAIEDRDHLLAARAAEADAPTKQCSPGNRVRNSTEWHIAGLRAGSLAKTRAGRRDASNLSLGQRLGDEHTTLPIFKWLKSSVERLSDNSDRPHHGLPKEAATGPETAFGRLSCRRTWALMGAVTIYQTVSMGTSSTGLPPIGLLRTAENPNTAKFRKSAFSP